ncbi:unnamed protein product [Rotaria magnacalcarata]|nr:unnamed protein product [Rotaria magnacalcarata]
MELLSNHLFDAADEHLYDQQSASCHEIDEDQVKYTWRTALASLFRTGIFESHYSSNENQEQMKDFLCQLPFNQGTYNLDRDQYAALQIFYSSFSEKARNSIIPNIATGLNHIFRHEDDGNILELCLPYSKLLLKALKKLPSQKKIVWRAAKTVIQDGYNIGDTIVWQGISICTANKNVIMNYATMYKPVTIFEIQCVDGKMIQTDSLTENQSIVLLMPHSYFEVIRVKELPNGYRTIALQETGGGILDEFQSIFNNLKKTLRLRRSQPRSMNSANLFGSTSNRTGNYEYNNNDTTQTVRGVMLF